MPTRFFAALFLLAAPASTSLSELRLTPSEIRASGRGTSQIGSSKITGVDTKVLFGDPTRAGFYAIILSVPARATIQAHSHRDDRIATVVSGEWHFGYGDRFSATALKTLPPGSVYSEPSGVNHFAQTGDEPVQVEISGYGPTDTHYFDTANDPKRHRAVAGSPKGR